jgi:uncharacterized 2Fe-2S/4Fe-4S cluster protein (DUF4445 family)
MSANQVRIRLEPLAVEVDVPVGAPLVSSLSDHGFEFPCGGTGLCGGCGVRVLSGSLPITEADRAAFPPEQLSLGWRLACQARAPERATQPLVLECGQWEMDVLTDNAGLAASGKHGLGIAIDLGTTTIAAQIIDLATGSVLGVETELNPQAPFGSDVMNRIRAALDGNDLTTPIRAALGQIVARLAHGRESEINEVVLVGNTVMHHLFSARSVEPLSHAPFVSPHLGEQIFSPHDLGWPLPSTCTIRFAPCLGGFVGADILAGILSTGIARSDDLMALVDLGTNGEIAIGNRQGIVCASTAAGPAFEAGSIRMGMRAVTGAISYVSLVGDEQHKGQFEGDSHQSAQQRTSLEGLALESADLKGTGFSPYIHSAKTTRALAPEGQPQSSGQMHATVIGGGEPRGLCGSGLVDAVAAGLTIGAILPSGRIANGTKLFPVAAPVVLYQSDIRELQLAKGAIAAGFNLLLDYISARPGSLKSVHLAGAFGNYVQIESALRIGLIDTQRELIHAAGNTALRGAKMLLLAASPLTLPRIHHVSLAADPNFQHEFAHCMTFPGRGDS